MNSTMSIRDRLKQAASKGYGLALCLRGEARRTFDSATAAERLITEGVPVLAECSGALGVLRGLDLIRCRGLLAGLAASGETVLVVHWTPEEPDAINWTECSVARD